MIQSLNTTLPTAYWGISKIDTFHFAAPKSGGIRDKGRLTRCSSLKKPSAVGAGWYVGEMPLLHLARTRLGLHTSRPSLAYSIRARIGWLSLRRIAISLNLRGFGSRLPTS